MGCQQVGCTGGEAGGMEEARPWPGGGAPLDRYSMSEVMIGPNARTEPSSSMEPRISHVE